MLTLDQFRQLEAAVRTLGHGAAIEWSQAIEPPPSADAFAAEAVYVICNSGMRVTIAARIAERCLDALRNGGSAGSVFGHRSKTVAIDEIWAAREELFHQLKDAEDLIEFCAALPFLGPVTKYHLAKNLGADVAKPDVHLTRIAAREGCDPHQLCARLAAEGGLRIAAVDTILWRACADGVLDSRRYLEAGWDEALRTTTTPGLSPTD